MSVGTIPGRLLFKGAAVAVVVAGVALAIWPYASPSTPAPAERAITLPTRTPQPTASATAKAVSQVTRQPKPTLQSKPPTSTPTATPTTGPVRHIIRSGEMLLVIAAEYDTSVEKIMMVNEITDPTTIQIGQELLIPVTATPAGKVTPQPTPKLVFHTIEPGDTLLALALQYDTSVESLMAANWISNPAGLQIGQKLVIPTENGTLPDPILWAPTAVHEVESGDTLLDLALAYGSSVEDILAANPDLAPTSLQIGQQLSVPLTRQKINPGGSQTAAVKLAAAPTLSAADLAALKKGSPSLVGLEQAMVEAVNAERQGEALPPFAVDEQLTLMAWGQAQDMVKRGYFGHVTPEGRTLRDRFEDRGLASTRVGENIYLSVKPANQAVQAAIGWFMGDPPHRRNILHAHFNRIGVGVAQESSGWYTFVLVFAGD
ncbi:MAG: LysM peptidoglycan-binding domain-containing protein [Anaerolineales bacterium]|nr:LysM peptidoglycan-binding domain-containing protein [Anaerolineales bacterium]